MLSDLVLYDVRVNEAVKSILNQYRLVAKDLTGNNLLVQSAERLIQKSVTDIQAALQPPPEQTPFLRIGAGRAEYPVPSVQFVRVDGFYTIPLYFGYYSQDADFEEQRWRHLEFCVRWLEEPTLDPNEQIGLTREGAMDWFFKIGSWTCVIDNDTPLKFLKGVTLTPPYYVSRVDLTIQLNEIGQRAIV